MAFLPRPVTRMMLSTPDASASSTPYWMVGLSTSGSISLGWALVAGRNRVPRPAAGKTALRTDELRARLETRGGGTREAVERLAALDKERRAVLPTLENLKRDRNQAGEQIA